MLTLIDFIRGFNPRTNMIAEAKSLINFIRRLEITHKNKHYFM